MNNSMMFDDLPTGDLNEDELKELEFILGQQSSVLKDYKVTDKGINLIVKLINKTNNPDPTYAKHGDSGFDLRANLTNGGITVPAGKVVGVPTGLFFQIPYGFELQVRPRSGLALKSGITVLNTPGTVDSGYRGEVVAILYNTGAFGDFNIYHGDRIAQAVISAVQCDIHFEKVTELDPTDRGEGGFGSSGTK